MFVDDSDTTAEWWDTPAVLQDGERFVSTLSARELTRLHHAFAVVALQAPSWKGRGVDEFFVTCVERLRTTEDGRFREYLLRLAGDSECTLRNYAVNALRELIEKQPDPDVEAVLLDSLADPDSGVRDGAYDSLRASLAGCPRSLAAASALAEQIARVAHDRAPSAPPPL